MHYRFLIERMIMVKFVSGAVCFIRCTVTQISDEIDVVVERFDVTAWVAPL